MYDVRALRGAMVVTFFEVTVCFATVEPQWNIACQEAGLLYVGYIHVGTKLARELYNTDILLVRRQSRVFR